MRFKLQTEYALRAMLYDNPRWRSSNGLTFSSEGSVVFECMESDENDVLVLSDIVQLERTDVSKSAKKTPSPSAKREAVARSSR